MTPASQGRRRFIKVGVAGGLALAGASLLYRVTHHRSAPGANFVLEGEARALIAALLPALLDGVAAVSEPPHAEAAIKGVEQAISGLSAAAQGEIADLFSLLTLAPTRVLVVGVSRPWAEASRDEVAAFLGGWRFSRFALLQQGYAALHDLVLGAWYGDAAHWEAIGYPGPPEVS